MGSFGKAEAFLLIWITISIQALGDIINNSVFNKNPIDTFTLGNQLPFSCGVTDESVVNITLYKGQDATDENKIASVGTESWPAVIHSNSYTSRADVTGSYSSTGGTHLGFTIRISTCDDRGQWICKVSQGGFYTSRFTQLQHNGGDCRSTTVAPPVVDRNYTCFACSGDGACNNPSVGATPTRRYCKSCLKIVNGYDTIYRNCNNGRVGDGCQIDGDTRSCVCTGDLCNGTTKTINNSIFSALTVLLVLVLQRTE